MLVAEITAGIARVRLKKPIKHASHVRTETDNIIVRCRLQDGSVGYGEGVPREYVTGESATDAIALLKRSDLKSQLSDAGDFESAVATIEKLRIAAPDDDGRKIFGNAARCAVETALLDAYGRHFRRNLGEIPKLLAPELYSPKTQVRYSGVITSAKGMKAKFRAWTMRIYGFHDLKVKVGIHGQDDVARLKSIRRRIGSMTLRIDANEAWDASEVVERIRELEPFRVSSVEQPIPHEQSAALPDIRKQISTPIMLDESLCGMLDAELAINNHYCDLFNLRLSKCGGLIPTLRIAQRAKRGGIGYQLGCQVGETCILSALGRQFAANVGDIRFLEGSYDKRLVHDALGKSDITFGFGGKAPALSGPGLGIDIDEQRVNAIVTTWESLYG